MVTVNIELRSTQRLFGLTSKLSTSAIVNNNVTIIIAIIETNEKFERKHIRLDCAFLSSFDVETKR